MHNLEQRLEQHQQAYAVDLALQHDLQHRYGSLQQQLHVVEEEQASCQRRIGGVEVNRERIVLEEVHQAAVQLAQRNGVYHTQKQKRVDTALEQRDERIIQVYEQNRDFPEIAKLLESQYLEAAVRKEERTRERQAMEQKISAGVVLLERDGRIELYLSILYRQQNLGLMQNLVEAMGNALLVDHARLQEPTEKEGILVLYVQGDTATIVERLRQQQPDEFASANVDYTVIVIGARNGEELNGTSVLPPAAGAGPAPPSGAQEDPEKRIPPSLTPLNRERTRASVRNLFADHYIPIQDVSALTGTHSTSLYSHSDLHGGPLKTELRGRERYVELDSLLSFLEGKFGPLKMYSLLEAAQQWRQRLEQELRATIEPQLCEEYIRLVQENGDLHTIAGRDGQHYVGERELNRLAVNYLARRKIEGWTQETIPRDILATMLQVDYYRLAALAKDGKFDMTRNKQRVKVDSVRRFLDSYHYDGDKWILKKNPRKKGDSAQQ